MKTLSFVLSLDAELVYFSQRVVLSTIHSAVDVDWPIIFVPAVEKNVFPNYRATSEEQIEEERRLLYVAVTRAQACCVLSFVQPPSGRSKLVWSFRRILTDTPSRLQMTLCSAPSLPNSLGACSRLRSLTLREK